MKIEGYEEISRKEFNKLSIEERSCFSDGSEHKSYYFRKAQKFPIVFEDNDYKIRINEVDLTINNKRSEGMSVFNYKQSFPLLVKAVEKAKEVSKLKK